MSDITALIATMKAEDISPDRMEWLKKLADMEYCASNPGHWLMSLKENNYLAALALQCLENNLALVEALVARDKQIAEMQKPASKPVAQIEVVSGVLVRERWMHSSLTDGWHDLFSAPKPESRTVTVKLPTTRFWAGMIECYEKADVITAIREAGGEISND